MDLKSICDQTKTVDESLPEVKLVARVDEIPFDTIPFFPFLQPEGKYSGQPFPFMLQKGELTLLAGSSGCGKSLLMAQTALHFAVQGLGVAIVPFDNGVDLTAERLTSQALFRMGRPAYTKEEVLKAIKEVAKIRIIETPCFLTFGSIKGFVQKTVRSQRKRTSIVFLDSAVFFVKDQEDKTYWHVLKELKELTRELGVHVCVLDGMEDSPSNTNDESYLDQATDQSLVYNFDELPLFDNIITFAQNQGKFSAKKFGKPFDDNIPDHQIRICKQAWGPDFSIPLWFDETSLSFCTTPDRIPPAL